VQVRRRHAAAALPMNAMNSRSFHSITLSVRASTEGGIFRASGGVHERLDYRFSQILAAQG
jgi:hypothetical protein